MSARNFSAALLAGLKATPRDQLFLTLTVVLSLVLGIAVLVLSILGICAIIRSRTYHSRVLTVLLLGIAVGDLMLAPGSIGYNRFLKGWKGLNVPLLHAQVVLRDAFVMAVSVGQLFCLLLLSLYQLLATFGSTKLESQKLAIVLVVVAWIYSILLIAVVPVHYGLEYSGYLIVYVLLLPRAYIPQAFVQVWYMINAILLMIGALTAAIINRIKAGNSVQPMNNGVATSAATQASTDSTPLSPKLALALIVPSVIFWLPYVCLTASVAIDLRNVKYSVIHSYNFVYLLVMVGVFVRSVVCSQLLPHYSKALSLSAKCKWSEPI